MFTYTVVTKCPTSAQVTVETIARILPIYLEQDGPDCIKDKKGKCNENGYSPLCHFMVSRGHYVL